MSSTGTTPPPSNQFTSTCSIISTCSQPELGFTQTSSLFTASSKDDSQKMTTLSSASYDLLPGGDSFHVDVDQSAKNPSPIDVNHNEEIIPSSSSHENKFASIDSFPQDLPLHDLSQKLFGTTICLLRIGFIELTLDCRLFFHCRLFYQFTSASANDGPRHQYL